MATKIIEINKDLIPYTTKFRAPNGVFKLRFRYNQLADRIYVDLYDSKDVLIKESEMMQYGIPLWYQFMEDAKGNLYDVFPDCWLIPLSADGVERPVNYENLSDTIFLTLQDRVAGTSLVDLLLYENA